MEHRQRQSLLFPARTRDLPCVQATRNDSDTSKCLPLAGQISPFILLCQRKKHPETKLRNCPNMAPIHGYTRTLHRVIPVMCAVTLAACTWAHSFAAESELLAVGQRDSPLTRIPASPQNDQFYLGQRTRNGTLTLTANECFFPKLSAQS